ncbi:MAG: hypothetical protein U1E23_14825 [Reyranellaceae bacterium]
MVTIPWAPRTDGKHAVLVTERRTVFDRRVIVPTAVVDDEPAAALTALGPLPTEWTADLVHCCLVHVYGALRELPTIAWPARYRSVLGQLQPQEPGAVRRPLGTDVLDRIDWTLARLFCWGEDDQAILLGFMSGLSLREISTGLKRLQARGIGMGKGVNKTTVSKRYRTITSTMADEWNRAGQPIDAGTREAWMTAGRRKQ